MLSVDRGIENISLEPGQIDFWKNLFDNPLDEELPLWQRVVNVAIHIITLLIPFLIYQAYRSSQAADSSQEIQLINKRDWKELLELPLKTFGHISHEVFPSTCDNRDFQLPSNSDLVVTESISDALIELDLEGREKIASELESVEFYHFMTQPNDDRIYPLLLLYGKRFDQFASAYKEKGEDIFDVQVRQLANQLINIAFAISYLSLKDAIDMDRPDPDLIKSAESYAFGTFWIFPNLYILQMMKVEVTFTEKDA